MRFSPQRSSTWSPGLVSPQKDGVSRDVNPEGTIWEHPALRKAFQGRASRHSFLNVSDGLSVKHTQLVAKESPGTPAVWTEDFDLGCQDSCQGMLILQTD